MKKIPSLFKRDFEGNRSLVLNEVNPDAAWVIAGEGVATRKFDGTCCMVRDGKLFKRYDVKKGKPTPEGFEPAQEPDETTGHWPGWLPVGDGPDDKWHRAARDVAQEPMKDGTYELVGPKIQGNPEGYDAHLLVKHGNRRLSDCPRDFEGLRAYLAQAHIEGIVWHHPDGRMAKIKAKDFGISR